jgi:hypothetical protein
MNDVANHSWAEANQRYLSASLALVRHALERHAAGEGASDDADDRSRLEERLNQASEALPSPSALDTFCARFGLSAFERDTLLLCAGIEFDGSFASLYAAAHREPSRNHATFSLALAALPDPEWNALTPAAPLRYWRLIEVGAAPALALAPLRIDERILHYLAGVNHLDERLAGIVEHVAVEIGLVPSQLAVAERIVEAWSRSSRHATWPVVQICGDDATGRRAVAIEAASKLGMSLYGISPQAIPVAPSEFDALVRLWERESILNGSALLIDCEEMESSDTARMAAARLASRVRSMVIVSGEERLRTPGRPTIAFDLHRPQPEEQQMLWRNALGEDAAAMNGEIGRLVWQFNLSSASIQAASIQAASPDALWDACRAQARPRLDDLAQHIETTATWDDLVLPELQRRTLREIASHVRQRGTVYERWGFARKSSRGLGISVLFAGSSGTGKTMAAEVLAAELRLDLYRIDLSQVVSKYIGETEKNLRRVFDAAEEGGAILLFDEADALFGKRSEVKDSHDRYANIEVSYLLQRMEAYRGLAILTTNMKGALDTAFLRRLRFVVEFPFPDAAMRAEIWRRSFPASTPTDRLDIERLARLNVAGGNISNIALGAAFLAAAENQPVGMQHLLRSARSEYTKLERPLTDAEVKGWI